MTLSAIAEPKHHQPSQAASTRLFWVLSGIPLLLYVYFASLTRFTEEYLTNLYTSLNSANILTKVDSLIEPQSRYTLTNQSR